jgi:streptomycin 6-kinase
MNTFEKNILSIYRQEGRRWLQGLPRQVQELKVLWDLDRLTPLNNLSYNYVLQGFKEDVPIILKLSPDTKSLHREAQALNAFREFGAALLLDRKENALLLQQALPGCPLKNSSFENSIEIACNVAERLHQASVPQDAAFPNIEE